MSESGIVLKNLQLGWLPEKPVCRIESLQLARHNITVLCGPNGAGKTTLLKTIARQIRPLSGEIWIDGDNQAALSPVQIARRLAYVPQFMEARRSLSVEEWVALGRNPHQKWWSWSSSAKDRDKIDEALARTACMPLRKQAVETLSGGERQRLLIATALAQEPSYILLDEPAAHLDFRHQLELLNLLKQLKEEGLGLLVVMHDLNLTARLADHVVLLKRTSDRASEVAACGTLSEVLAPDKLRAVYGVEMEILTGSDGKTLNYIANAICENGEKVD